MKEPRQVALLVFAIAVVAAWATSARAEICIQGVHDCLKTQTTDEGGFNPRATPYQKNPSPDSTIEYLQYFSMLCLPIVTGDRTTRPLPEYRTYLENLRSAGIISYRIYAPPSGAPGEIGVDVQIMPEIGPEHFKPGAGTCLKGAVRTNIAITGWQQQDILTSKGNKTPVIIAEGTSENVEYDSVFLRYLKVVGGRPIFHEKFRLLYAYEGSHSAWDLITWDSGEIGETGFRTNHVDEYLQRLRQM
jgi:hypothetical protein